MDDTNSWIRHLLEGGSSLMERIVSSSFRMSGVEEQIERSKSHWSSLVENDSSDDDEVAEESNVGVFESLQMDPLYGDFFATFGGDGGVHYSGQLMVGKKFAEGAQAELFEVKIMWIDPRNTELDMKTGREYVLKVFKKGTYLKHLKCQFPEGLLKYQVETRYYLDSATPKLGPQYFCQVLYGPILNDGRFAFVMQKEHLDLRTLIDNNMRWRLGRYYGPFSKTEAEHMMYRVALGLDWLHSHGIVHRDVKAANVLIRISKMEGLRSWIRNLFLFTRKPNPGMLRMCFVADYECSIGVFGTGFFMAPEILQACKDGKLIKRPEVFSKAADIYSFGMTCYEILVGKLPFEGYPIDNSHDRVVLVDRVIDQHLRPRIPRYVETWTRELLSQCWQSDPITRPTIGEILDMFSLNSPEIRNYENFLRKDFGNNFRSNFKQE